MRFGDNVCDSARWCGCCGERAVRVLQRGYRRDMDAFRQRVNPFEAMAEPVRRRLVEVLASGEHTAGELAAAVGNEFHISRTAVSKHLRVLRDAGFVDVYGDQQWRWYFLVRSGIAELEDAVADLRAKMAGGHGWDADLRQERDPTEDVRFFHPAVPRKGPGRPRRRGTRGHRATRYYASEPDYGLYPMSAPPAEDEGGWLSSEPGGSGAPPRIDG